MKANKNNSVDAFAVFADSLASERCVSFGNAASQRQTHFDMTLVMIITSLYLHEGMMKTLNIKNLIISQINYKLFGCQCWADTKQLMQLDAKGESLKKSKMKHHCYISLSAV